MVPLIPLSMVMMALVVHYLLTIRRGTLVPGGLVRSMRTASAQGQAGAVRHLVVSDDTMLGRPPWRGCRKSRKDATPLRGDRRDRRGVGDATAPQDRVPQRDRNVSPMIGLFGTVVGMIQAFGRIYSAGGGMPEPTNWPAISPSPWSRLSGAC